MNKQKLEDRSFEVKFINGQQSICNDSFS